MSRLLCAALVAAVAVPVALAAPGDPQKRLTKADQAKARPSTGGGRPPADLSKLMQLMAEAQAGMRNPTEVRAEIGAFALAAETPSEEAFIARAMKPTKQSALVFRVVVNDEHRGLLEGISRWRSK